MNTSSQLAREKAFRIAPIPGITTAEHIAPSTLVVPVGCRLDLIQQNLIEQRVTWNGHLESTTKTGLRSVARVDCSVAGSFNVRASVVGGEAAPVENSIRVVVTNDAPMPRARAMEVSISAFEPPSAPSTLSRSDIRTVREDSYITSCNRPFRLRARPEPVADSLLEWRADGHCYLGTEVDLVFPWPGAHVVRIGSPKTPKEIKVMTFDAHLATPIGVIERALASGNGRATVRLHAAVDDQRNLSQVSWAAKAPSNARVRFDAAAQGGAVDAHFEDIGRGKQVVVYTCGTPYRITRPS